MPIPIASPSPTRRAAVAEAAVVNIAVLAKAPLPGLAKTRLAPALGMAGAARLQRQLALRAVATALEAGLGPVTLCCAPDRGQRFFRAVAKSLGPRLALHDQPAGDLGERMQAAFVALCESAPTLVIGTDCPALTCAHLRAAAASLRAGSDAVVLPAEDGGYVLIGLRRPVPALFEGIDWGSERVMAQTRERLRAAGIAWHEGATLWDVDRPEDLARLDAFELTVRRAVAPPRAGAPVHG